MPSNCGAFDSTFERQQDFIHLPDKIWAGSLPQKWPRSAGHLLGFASRKTKIPVIPQIHRRHGYKLLVYNTSQSEYYKGAAQPVLRWRKANVGLGNVTRKYISQLIRFARVSSHVVDFNARNKSLTAKLLQQGYRYHKLWKTFSKFYRRHYELVSKFNVGLKTLLHQGLSEPEFYGELVYKFKKIEGRADFSDQKNDRSLQTYWI